MTSHEQEIAALLALDALEADEQADAELRMGTFPAELRAISAALAEGTAVAPPTELRQLTLDRALARRPGGRPGSGIVPCRASEAFARTMTEFAALLGELSLSDWDAPAHAEHGTVRHLVAHLIGIERLSARWLRDDPDLPRLPDHVAATRDVVDELGGADPADLLRAWNRAVRAVATAAAARPSTDLITFHDLTLTVDGYLVTRTFELWAHAMDIAVATGRALPVLDDERMALMSHRLMGAVPDALAYRGRPQRGRTGRFVLTGPAGGCYTVALSRDDASDEPDFTVVTSALDICRIAARRLARADLDVTVEGDIELAELVLAEIDAFARD